MHNSHLTKWIMSYDHRVNETWSTNLHSICLTTDNEYHYESLIPVNVKASKKLLLTMYQETWLIEVKQKPKLSLYGNIKEKYEVSSYVKVSLPKDRRSLLCKCYVAAYR